MYQLRGKLSIVMPAYNEEALIYNSIMQTLSIVEQFAPDLEIIAVNDGSKDDSGQICDSYAAAPGCAGHAGVRYTHKAGDIQ